MTQPRDNTGKEELVEEIPDKVMAEVLGIWSSCMVMNEMSPEEAAKQTIAVISQAIERGDILLTKVPPELPEEVSRWDLSDTWQSGDWLRWAYEQLDARTFIALRPEEEK